MPFDDSTRDSGGGTPPEAPLYPYEFDPGARDQARRLGRVRLALALYSVDFLLLPFLLLLLASGVSAGLRDRAFAFDPATGLAWLDAGLRVAVYAVALTALCWLALLVPAIGISLDLRRAAGRQRSPAAELWGRIAALPFLCAASIGFAIAFYLVVWLTPGWWLLAAAALAGFTLAYMLVLLHWHRSTSDPKGVPPALGQRFAELARLAGFPGTRLATSKAKKPGAFTFGLGGLQTVVLSQDLVSKMHPRELDVVLAHELGHVANRDLLRKGAAHAAVGLLSLGILASVLESAVGAFGIATRWDVASLPLVLVYLRLAALATAPLANAHSQRRELAADRYALGLLRDPVAYVSAQKRLADLDFVESRPSFFSRVFSTHPSLDERLDLAGNHVTRPRDGGSERLK